MKKDRKLFVVSLTGGAIALRFVYKHAERKYQANRREPAQSQLCSSAFTHALKY